MLNICQAQVGDQNESANAVFNLIDLGFTCIFTIGMSFLTRSCERACELHARNEMCRLAAVVTWDEKSQLMDMSGRAACEHFCYLDVGVYHGRVELVRLEWQKCHRQLIASMGDHTDALMPN